MDRIYLPFYRSFMIKDKGESICSVPTGVSLWPLIMHTKLVMSKLHWHYKIASMQCIIACSCGCKQYC